MKIAVDQNLDWADCLIMTAAVADFSPNEVSKSKLKKEMIGKEQTLTLTQNVDILTGASKTLKDKGRIAVGFAAETSSDLVKAAHAKLQSKGCSVLVANDVSDGKVFGEDATSVVIVTEQEEGVRASGTKLEVAHKLLDVISDML
jgi:phosphopantothenoylcysteine decarboxylase/phosphopantothenate--cysteine ligase